MLGAYLGRRLALWMFRWVEDFLSLWSGGGERSQKLLAVVVVSWSALPLQDF